LQHQFIWPVSHTQHQAFISIVRAYIIVRLQQEGSSQLDRFVTRSEEHTSELQSRENLVCRLLLEKKKKKYMGDAQVIHEDIILYELDINQYYPLLLNPIYDIYPTSNNHVGNTDETIDTIIR